MAGVAFSAIVSDTVTVGSDTFPRRRITATVDSEGVWHGPYGGEPTRTDGVLDPSIDGCLSHYTGILSNSSAFVSVLSEQVWPSSDIVYQTFSIASMSGVTTASALLAQITWDEIITTGAIYRSTPALATTGVAIPVVGTPPTFFTSAPTHVIFAYNGSTVATDSPPVVNTGCVPMQGIAGKCMPFYSSGRFISPAFGGAAIIPPKYHMVLDQTNVVLPFGIANRCEFTPPNGGSTWGGQIILHGCMPVPASVVVAVVVDLPAPYEVRPVLWMNNYNGFTQSIIWTGSSSASAFFHEIVTTAAVTATVPDGCYGYAVFASWQYYEPGAGVWLDPPMLSPSPTVYVEFAGLMRDVLPCPVTPNQTQAGWGYAPAFTSKPVALA